MHVFIQCSQNHTAKWVVNENIQKRLRLRSCLNMWVCDASAGQTDCVGESWNFYLFISIFKGEVCPSVRLSIRTPLCWTLPTARGSVYNKKLKPWPPFRNEPVGPICSMFDTSRGSRLFTDHRLFRAIRDKKASDGRVNNAWTSAVAGCPTLVYQVQKEAGLHHFLQDEYHPVCRISGLEANTPSPPVGKRTVPLGGSSNASRTNTGTKTKTRSTIKLSVNLDLTRKYIVGL